IRFGFHSESPYLSGRVIVPQHVMAIVNRERLVQMLTHQHTASCQTEAEGLLRDLQTAAFESDRIVVVDDPFLLLRKDLLQILSWIGKKCRSRLLGRDTETGIVQF